MAKTLFNKIYVGSLASYTAATKDANSLYMTTDGNTGVKAMYKGSTKVGGDFIIVNGAAPTSPEKGIIYYISEFGKTETVSGKPYVGFWYEGKWVALSDQATIDDLDARLTKVEGAIKIDGTATTGSIGEKVATLDGADTVDGSVKKQIKDAVEALDVTDTAVAKSFVTTVSETDGKITVSRGSVTSADKTVTIGDNTDGGIDLAVNIDGTTLVKDSSTGVISVDSSALVQGENAITVSDGSDGKQKISLTIDSEDKVLTQSTSGLLANLSLTYDSTNKKIVLGGKDNTTINEIDASDFIKDGMLAGTQVFLADAETKEITISGQSHTFEGLTKGHHYIAFLFKIDGKEVSYQWDILDATDIIDVYVAGDGLSLTGHTFAVKIDSASETFLTVSADGIKLSGVQDAIDGAIEGLGATVTGTGNNVTVDITEVDGVVTASAASDVHTSESYTAVTTYPTIEGVTFTPAAASQALDNAINAVDTNVATLANEVLKNEETTSASLNDLKTRVGNVNDLTTESKVVVGAINELKSAIEDKNVTAEGDDYVSASASDNKVTVSATDSTKASLALADTAVQSVAAASEGQEVTVTTTTATGGSKNVTIGVTKATYTQATESAEGVLSTAGLVDATVLKNYVADEIAKNAVYWEEL